MATEDALAAVQAADAIVIGPGSLYTSILPNLLIDDLAVALARSSAPKIYICNAMTQPHETDRFSAFDHVNTIVEHTRPEILSHVVVNSGRIPAHMLKKYELEEAHPVTLDTARIASLGYTVIETDIITSTDMVRHNPRRLTKLVLDIIVASKKRHAEEEKKKNSYVKPA